MKNRLFKIVMVVLILASFFIFLATAGYNVPYIYTIFWGDKNTRTLYDVYKFAKRNPDRKILESYLSKLNKEVKYSYDKQKDQYVIYSTTAAEAVYITYSNDKVSDLFFSPD